jgi:hypothetical protein
MTLIRPVLFVALLMLAATLVSPAAASSSPQEPNRADVESAEPSWSALTRWITLLTGGQLPSLDGLIRPEEVEVLADNQIRMRDFTPKLSISMQIELHLHLPESKSSAPAAVHTKSKKKKP